MTLTTLLRVACGFLFMLLCFSCAAMGQTETATVSGLITDSSGAVVVGAEVQLQSVERGTFTTATTNDAGIYVFASVHPGQYQVTVRKAGFTQVDLLGLIVNIQDHIEQNFRLQVGSVSESVTVTGGAPLINTESGAVSTVVDRQFVENIPLNGRSFQTLIALSPGVVLTPSSFPDPGQFSVNGQRASTNYFTVDGVSANIGIQQAASLSQTAGGSIPGFSVSGGTNNLVSEDALQEFRIQTSTFAAEFGRTPGAQVSIVTRSGTNQFHGTLFEFLRNDKLDANDWFSNQKGLPKSKERVNDFGGVLGGPIVRNRTFFFLSYEGQRLRLPQTGITTVPSVSARQSASAAIQPFLNAYPVPNGANLANNQAQFSAGFSSEVALNATSIRIDHTLSNRLTIFGRYNHAPSDLLQRGANGVGSLNTLTSTRMKTQTLTLAAIWFATPVMNNDFRFNYSRAAGMSSDRLDTFGGAVLPPESTLFPAPFSSDDGVFQFTVIGLRSGRWILGKLASNRQQQFNVVDSISLQRGSHTLKFGIDYRRLSPFYSPPAYTLVPTFRDVASVLLGKPSRVQVSSNRDATVLFRNLSLFAQDTWRVSPRLSVAYGLRWDVDFAPSTIDGPSLQAVTGFGDPSTLALAPSGTPVFATKYHNFAPRIGVVYKLRQAQGWETALRGGFGIFYDLATQGVGEALTAGNYPFGVNTFLSGNLTFPLNTAIAQPPPISVNSLKLGLLFAVDPNLKLPRTFQWNFTLEQSLGNVQAVSAAYVAAIGRRLLQPELIFSPNPNFRSADFVRNSATSDYHSLQVQFRRRLSGGMQALASYTWSHSIDTGSSSAAGTGIGSNFLVGALGRNANRGSSDYDLRHTFSAAVTYAIPAARTNRAFHAALRDWWAESILQARSAAPVNVFDSNFSGFGADFGDVRPDLVSGVPLYVPDVTVAGGRRINPAAFVDPPIDPVTFLPLRQGTLGRNGLRGFRASQWDFAVRREFHLHESWRLQFRAEFFNLLNHPNFANLIGNLRDPFFGQSTVTLARSLGGSTFGNGGFAPIFQLGGPRSIQFGLKLLF